MRVVLIDDNLYARKGLAADLDAQPGIAIVRQLTQDEAMRESDDWFGDFDVAIVEVVDEDSSAEAATDRFSGISALRRLKSLEVVTFAITPHLGHPLIEQRIAQAGTNFRYHHREIQDPEWFSRELSEPTPGHEVAHLDRRLLDEFGAERADTNRAIEIYEDSPEHGHFSPTVHRSELQEDVTSEKSVTRLVEQIKGSGFNGERRRRGGEIVGYRAVQRYLSRLMGRGDQPASDQQAEEQHRAHEEQQ